MPKSTEGYRYAEWTIAKTGTYIIRATLTLKTDLKVIGYHVHTLGPKAEERTTIHCGPCHEYCPKDYTWTPRDLEVPQLQQGSTLYVGFLFIEHPPKKRHVALATDPTDHVHLRVELTRKDELKSEI